MKILAKGFASAWTNFVIFCLVFVGISDAKIDRGAIECLWLFDDGKGNVAKDSSGNGHHGDILGAKWVDGKFGKALEFDGVDDDVVVPTYFGVGGTEPRTTTLWFKASDTRDHSWVKWGPNVTGEKYYVRAHLAGAECYLRVEVAGGQSYGATNVCDEEWHHLAVVFPDGSDSVKDHLLYVDGALEQNPLGTDQVMDTNDKTQEVHMGAPLAHHTFANGLMDEIAIFSVALDENDINNIMNGGLSRALAVEYTDKLATTWAVVKTQY